jgi:hypothetical protein
MSNETTGETLPPFTMKVAVQWLMYQHGLEVATASDVMKGNCTESSRMGKMRQEAIDVAYFVEALND